MEKIDLSTSTPSRAADGPSDPLHNPSLQQHESMNFDQALRTRLLVFRTISLTRYERGNALQVSRCPMTIETSATQNCLNYFRFWIDSYGDIVIKNFISDYVRKEPEPYGKLERFNYTRYVTDTQSQRYANLLIFYVVLLFAEATYRIQ